MADTYSQIILHIVFAVRKRENVLNDIWREELHRYITGIIRNREQNLIVINSVSDHIHILIAVRPNIVVSNLVRDIKNNSSKFINNKGWLNRKFNWQRGFGVFSLSHSQIERAKKYISLQKLHHSRKPFQEEYIELLCRYHIQYDEKYVFD